MGMSTGTSWRQIDWRPFSAAAVASTALLSWMGLGYLSFSNDECVFLARGFGELLSPHNEHLLAVQLIVWHATEAVFGSGSYLPYFAFLMACHVALAGLVYYALGGGLVALASSSLLLLLGSASDSMFYAGLSGFILSTAFGVLAMLVIERRQYGWAAASLALAVTSSGIGLAFLAGAFAMAGIQRERRAVWLVLPGVVYVAWFVVFGREGITSHTNPLDNVGRVPGLVGQWTLDGLSAISGLPGWAVLLSLLLGAVWVFRRGWRPSPLAMGSAAGVAALFTIIALVRDGALVARYITPFAVLVLLIVGRMPWPRNRLLVGAALAVFAWALVINVAGLIRYEYEFAYFLSLGYGCH